MDLVVTLTTLVLIFLWIEVKAWNRRREEERKAMRGGVKPWWGSR